jgi:Tfp pilus assembly PilM family ATPase
MVDYESVEIPSPESIYICDFGEETITALLGNDRNLASHDYWTSKCDAEPRTLNLAWTSSEFASELSTGLARDGWRCVALDIPAQSLARVSSLGEHAQKKSIVVDIGAGEVSIVFAVNSNSEYIRNRIRFSANSAADTLAEALGIRKDAAQNLLVYWGVGGVDSTESSQLEMLIAQHLSQWLQQLVYELRRTLNFIQHRFGSVSECELLLCGGGANIRGLPDLLTTKLRNLVRSAEPPVSWTWKSAEGYSPIYAQAVSLAMYGAAT